MVGRELLTGAFAEGLTTSVGMCKWISCKVNAGQSEGLVNDEVSGQGTVRRKDAGKMQKRRDELSGADLIFISGEEKKEVRLQDTRRESQRQSN